MILIAFHMQPSPQKTPTTRKGVSSTEPDHVKSKATVHDTRLALASIGLHYDRPGIKDKYPAFFEVVENHLKVERASAMAAKSAKKCIEYSYENATTNEKSYHEGMKPLVLKDSYTGTSNKRDFAGELKRQEMSFADDDNLISRPDMLFPTCTLPYAGKGLGLTIPKPDWLYGMKQNMYQWPQDRVPDHVRPYISFGADLDHPFFAIENKGCEGTFEDCENQCMRTGAALVHARRHLNRLADTTATTGLASPPASTSIATGPDHDSFYFTCAWATGMARIFVHWFEDMGPEEEGLMHTTRLKSYLADSEDHLKEFRMVGHNIYDWGIHVNQKASKAAVAKIVERAKKERAGRT